MKTVLYLQEHREITPAYDDPAQASKKITLDYYLMENEVGYEIYNSGKARAETVRGAGYGIRITKAEGAAFEEISAPDITVEQTRARRLIRLLADNDVTPCGLPDVLEELLERPEEPD
jgi:hypothetical protein